PDPFDQYLADLGDFGISPVGCMCCDLLDGEVGLLYDGGNSCTWTNVLGQCVIDHLNCPDLHECFVELAYVWKSDETPPVFRWRVRAGLRPVGAIDPACSGFIGVTYESADKRLDECQQ